MYGYIYLTTNLINGRKYIGQHKSNKFSTFYKGSGKLIKQAFKKYGRKNFKVEMLESCNSINELNEREIYWIKYYKADQSKEFYNICTGGRFNRACSGKNNGRYHKPVSLETRRKIGDANRGRKWTSKQREVMREKLKGKTHSEEFKLMMKKRMSGENNPMYGKPGTMLGKHQKDISKKKISEKAKGRYIGENAPWYGKPRSEETKNKISNSRKGKYRGKDNPNYNNHKLKGASHPKAKRIYCKELDKEFGCIKDVHTELNISLKLIRECANNGIKCKGKYTLMFIN